MSGNVTRRPGSTSRPQPTSPEPRRPRIWISPFLQAQSAVAIGGVSARSMRAVGPLSRETWETRGPDHDPASRAGPRRARGPPRPRTSARGRGAAGWGRGRRREPELPKPDISSARMHATLNGQDPSRIGVRRAGRRGGPEVVRPAPCCLATQAFRTSGPGRDLCSRLGKRERPRDVPRQVGALS